MLMTGITPVSAFMVLNVLISMWLTRTVQPLLTHLICIIFELDPLMVFPTPQPVCLTGGSHCNPFKNINIVEQQWLPSPKQVVTIHAQIFISVHKTPSMLQTQTQNFKTICCWYLRLYALWMEERNGIFLVLSLTKVYLHNLKSYENESSWCLIFKYCYQFCSTHDHIRWTHSETILSKNIQHFLLVHL